MLYDDRYSALFAAMKAAAENAMKLSSVDLSGMSETLQRISRLQEFKPDLSPLMTTIQRISLADHSSYMSSLAKMQQLSQSFRDSLPVSDELQQSIIRVLRSAGSYMDDDQKAVVDEIDPEILNPSPEQPAAKPKLSLSNLLAILGILINLVFVIIQQMPDEQLEEIAAQNEVMIEQNEDLIRQNSEELALLQQLADTGNQIADLLEDAGVEIEDLTDLQTDPDQVSVDSPESDPGSDGQQDTADADQ